jgi:hypothetical protein
VSLHANCEVALCIRTQTRSLPPLWRPLFRLLRLMEKHANESPTLHSLFPGPSRKKGHFIIRCRSWLLRRLPSLKEDSIACEPKTLHQKSLTLGVSCSRKTETRANPHRWHPETWSFAFQPHCEFQAGITPTRKSRLMLPRNLKPLLNSNDRSAEPGGCFGRVDVAFRPERLRPPNSILRRS